MTCVVPDARTSRYGESDFFGEADQVVEPPGGLHRCQRGDARDDHADDSPWRTAGRQPEGEYEKDQPDPSDRAEGNPSQARARPRSFPPVA
jgi:hypothetical protein